MVECPKCGGGAFLSEEELVKVLENTEPMKIIAKATYQCRACSERFSRLVCDTLDARKKQEESKPVYTEASKPPERPGQFEPAEGIKFLDRV